MKRFNEPTPGKHVPVDLEINETPVYFIGPANRTNPMSQVRTKLLGTVHFYDRKIKWNRVTLQLVGKAGIDIEVNSSSLPSALTHDDQSTTRIHTVVPICEVEKELIFSGEESIDFGLHLPSNLPSSSRTDHAFVEYTLIANFSAGTFFKKYKTHKTVLVYRHYLPSPSAMIPTIEYSGVKEWFEWSAELPKASALQSGEVTIAFRYSVEKEQVSVDRIELAIEEIENYRFCTKQGVHNLPPITTRFPSATYHLPSFSEYSDTHFIRVPLLTSKTPGVRSVHTHQFDPFLEITHRCRLTVYFNKPAQDIKPIVLGFPIIITDYPPGSSLDTTIPDHIDVLPTDRRVVTGGDDAVNIDLDLPEYTPRYEEIPM
ncbi:hypothetical protein BY458DRAFT_451631 [Sporodiniella umbellata]|nr:hypothetical protein BY458DRAFT_451631 [Sporodiniella umbellata]